MADPIDTYTTRATRRSTRTQARLLIAATLFPTLHVSANCPQPTDVEHTEPFKATRVDPNAPVDVESDGLEAKRNGEWLLKGDVTIRQGDRIVKTRDATYYQPTNEFSVEHGIDYRDPNLRVRGAGAHLDEQGATFEHSEFELPTINGRGSAERISATLEGEVELNKARYTTCPIGNEDWLLTASEIDISQQRALGTARNVRLDFKGVPILYVPYFSFPVGNERKSGFLYPSFGDYSRDGFSVPWYWNIAPNMDATLVPTWDYRRGAKLDTEYRYLFPGSEGLFDAQYLPHDQVRGTSRSLLYFTDQSDFTNTLRLDVAAANASDDNWFEDFGQGPEGTSVTYLSRAAQLSHISEHWYMFGRAQNFQTIDKRIADANRPYTVVPQIAVHGWLPDQAYGLALGLDAELANFTHTVDNPSVLETGARFDVSPQVRMPLRTAAMYLEPAAAWRYTAYKLRNTAPGLSDTRTRSAPILSVDGGMSFERTTGSRGQRLQTLEPRFMYLYVPFRNQNDLPVFDTTLADLNLVQLFQTNRYVGADRLSDANQLSVGITSRLLDSENGKQFIAGTIGQAYYFSPPRVTLPGEPQVTADYSDIIGELDLTAYQNWNMHLGIQWSPSNTRAERGDVSIQYRPRYDSVVNLGYRFRRDIIETFETVPVNPAVPGSPTTTVGTRGNLEQVEGSVAWPLGDRWSAYGRLVYSLDNNSPLDQFAGFEYRSCCWKLRLVGRRYVRSREGDMATSILVQLELNGLSSVGTGAATFLQGAIRGYSARPPEGSATP